MRRRGLTLVEVIVALFVFATLMPLFVAIWPINKRAVTKSQSELAGRSLCKLVLDDAIGAGFDGVDAMTAVALADRTVTLKRSHAGVETTQDFVWEIATQTQATLPALEVDEKWVRATVSWREFSIDRKVSLETVIREE